MLEPQCRAGARRFQAQHEPTAPEPRQRSLGRLKRSASRPDLDEAVYPASAGEYELLEVVGEGSTSKVWRALCKQLGLEVAVKRVNLERQDVDLDMMVWEAQLARRQRHANIMPLLASFLHGQELWLILPLCACTLRALLDQAHPKGVDERMAATILREVLAGVAYLHGRSIVHRDIKASNVCLGADGRVYLSDLGAAQKLQVRLSTGPCNFGSFVRLSTFVGTPAAMAPELFGNEGYSLPADIYSFGILMVEVVVGEPPFAHLPLDALAVKKVQCAAPVLSVAAKGHKFSEELCDVLAQCLMTNPADRPSAERLLAHRFFARRSARDAPALVSALLLRLAGRGAGEGEGRGRGLGLGSGSGLRQRSGGIERSWGSEADLRRLADGGGGGGSGSGFSGSWMGGSAKSLRGHDPMAQGHFDGVSSLPALVAAALQSCKGIFIGRGGMRGVGIQQMFHVGFVVARLPGPDGRPVWSAPCPLTITAAHLGVGVGWVTHEFVHFIANDHTMAALATTGLAGRDLSIVDLDEVGMDVDAVRAHFRQAQGASAQRLSALAIRTRSGVAVNIWRTYGVAEPDLEEIKRMYGRPVEPLALLQGKVPPPPASAYRGFDQYVDDLNVLAGAGEWAHADIGLHGTQASAPEQSGGSSTRSAPHTRQAFSTALGVHRYRTSSQDD
ncbi:hypothetical protein WJX81_008022 [Elliptochloris bilobata]|uniref:Protein kinase domain-containing protein n=1 Tax=Elliptochloris bilobata TaxID=381761 RepID=A0AAW1QIT8_9CHLO